MRPEDMQLGPGPWPVDDFIEVTPLGAPAPVYIQGYSATDHAIAEAKARYISGDLTLNEYEQHIDEILRRPKD